jgi:hypothetical protein
MDRGHRQTDEETLVGYMQFDGEETIEFEISHLGPARLSRSISRIRDRVAQLGMGR